MPIPRISARYSRKVSDGNYGSYEVSMSIEMDVNDFSGGLDQLHDFLRKKVTDKIKEVKPY